MKCNFTSLIICLLSIISYPNIIFSQLHKHKYESDRYIYPSAINNISPYQNELNVQPNSNITITFDQDINQSTVNNNTIIVYGSNGSSYRSSNINYDSPSKTITYDPDYDFNVGEIITVVITKDSMFLSLNKGNISK